MKSGHIEKFAHLSSFKSVKEFNESTKHALQLHEHHFTKKERAALWTLIQYSVKYFGVCNARIDILVQASADKKDPFSRTTFERMQRKAKSLGILSVYPTISEKRGGDSHNVYVFHHFDGALSHKLTDRPLGKKQALPSPEHKKSATEATVIKTTKKTKDKDLRSIPLDTLDYTFVPSSIPSSFVKAVKPFFKKAKDICSLWDRAKMAYHSMRSTTQSINDFLPTIIQAFKETVYRYKKNTIKTSFYQYFYGTLHKMLYTEKRNIARERDSWTRWLDGEVELTTEPKIYAPSFFFQT